MHTIPEADARALLKRTLHCEDCGEWRPHKVQPGTRVLGIGAVDAEGVGVGMYVELIYRHGFRTNMTTYLFTLFKRHPYGKERVYQLEVTQAPRPVKDLHKQSHEHMGAARSIGSASWATWAYDEVLAYFCAQANVKFIPVPSDPESFDLKGDI